MFGLGYVFYVVLLLTNAIAILSEDRFLARIGWSSRSSSSANSGFGNVPSDPSYDPNYAASESEGMKVKMINLISAVRTLLRIPLIVANTVVILYELIAG